MSDSNKKVFTFSVDDSGQFTYEPSGDWAYTRKDTVRFETPSGPFSVRFLRKDGTEAPDPTDGPLGEQLSATDQNEAGTWAAETEVRNSFSDEERLAIMALNGGFIMKYNYAITVTKGGEQFSDSSHNGTWNC